MKTILNAKILLVGLLVISFNRQTLHAQDITLPVDESTNKVTYKGKETATGTDQARLFGNAKKWFVIRNSEANKYEVTFEDADKGEIAGKGSFQLTGERRKYKVRYVIKVNVKDNKFKYEISDFLVSYTQEAGSSSGGFGYFGSSSQHEKQTFDQALEIFYPSRLKSRKPEVRFFEEIRKSSFEIMSKEFQSLANSLVLSVKQSENW